MAIVKVTDVISGMQLEGLTTDLSEGGCCITARRAPFSPGTQILLEITKNGVSLLTNATVVYNLKDQFMGICFEEMPPDQAATLARWIKDAGPPVSSRQSAQLRSHTQTSAGSCMDFSAYACPVCKSGLTAMEGKLRCSVCAKTFPALGEIPDFVVEDLSRSASPVLRKSKRIGWLAPIYESKLWYQLVLNLTAGFGHTSLPRLITTIQQMLGPVTGTVLDVACGPGTYGRRVAGPSTKVYGVDISEGMLKQGVAYARREGVENVQFARAQVEALPFADATFDAAICSGSLHLFADTCCALREMARTMKRGARLGAITFTAGTTGLFRFRTVRERGKKAGLRLFEVAEMEECLRAAGFENYRPEVLGSLLSFSARRG